MKWLIIALLLLILSAALYTRFSPHSAADWHKIAKSMDAPGVYEYPGGFGKVIESDDPDALAQKLVAIIEASPRTTRLAGSVDEKHVSFVTRSALWGFPDTTNLWWGEGRLYIHGHLRFGKSDLGVNQRRIETWLKTLSMTE